MTKAAPEEWKNRWMDFHQAAEWVSRRAGKRILYMASDTSSFTTGMDLVVDGAFTCV